jgi:hypothetical protein
MFAVVKAISHAYQRAGAAWEALSCQVRDVKAEMVRVRVLYR